MEEAKLFIYDETTICKECKLMFNLRTHITCPCCNKKPLENMDDILEEIRRDYGRDTRHRNDRM